MVRHGSINNWLLLGYEKHGHGQRTWAYSTCRGHIHVLKAHREKECAEGTGRRHGQRAWAVGRAVNMLFFGISKSTHPRKLPIYVRLLLQEKKSF